MPDNPAAVARELYAVLRGFDEEFLTEMKGIAEGATAAGAATAACSATRAGSATVRLCKRSSTH